VGQVFVGGGQTLLCACRSTRRCWLALGLGMEDVRTVLSQALSINPRATLAARAQAQSMPPMTSLSGEELSRLGIYIIQGRCGCALGDVARGD